MIRATAGCLRLRREDHWARGVRLLVSYAGGCLCNVAHHTRHTTPPLRPPHTLTKQRLQFISRFPFNTENHLISKCTTQRALTLPAGPTHPRAAAGPPLQEQAAGRSTPETPAACDAVANMCNDAIACVNDALCCAPRDVLRRRVAHAAVNSNAPMLRRVSAAAGILFFYNFTACD